MVCYFYINDSDGYNLLIYLKNTKNIAQHGLCTISCCTPCRRKTDVRDVVVKFESTSPGDNFTSFFVVRAELQNDSRFVEMSYPSLLQNRKEKTGFCKTCNQPTIQFPYAIRSLLDKCSSSLQVCLDTNQVPQIYFVQNSDGYWCIQHSVDRCEQLEPVSIPRINSQFQDDDLCVYTSLSSKNFFVETTFCSEEMANACNSICMISDIVTLNYAQSGGLMLTTRTNHSHLDLFLPDVNGVPFRDQKRYPVSIETKCCKTISLFANFYKTCTAILFPNNLCNDICVFLFNSFVRKKVAQSELRWVPKIQSSQNKSQILFNGVLKKIQK